MQFLRSAIVLTTLGLVAGSVAAAPEAKPVYGVGAKAFRNVIKAKNPLRIVLTNDDSWASANIRATYYALRSAGHSVLMVAPTINQSGTGGTVRLPLTNNLTSPGLYDTIPVGAPYAGRNASDDGLRYFNGTPAACTFWALDQEAPSFFNKKTVELIVSGPNEGNNLGPFLYTLSGTIGSNYAGVERGIPGIAFSASSFPRDYHTLDLDSTKYDESIEIATATANIVTSYADQARKSSKTARLFPYGVGGSVNYSPLSTKCKASDLKYTHTRLTGSALVDSLVVNSTTGLPTYQNIVAKGLNACLSGDCSLPGETAVVANGSSCAASFSIYSVDYDAPTEATKKAVPALTAALKVLNK